jgi:hypothetical protein
MSRTYCSEVLSLARTPRAESQSGDHLSDVGTHGPPPQVKVLLISERVDGFFLERFTDRGELVGDSQYETLDDAMRVAYSEYTISDWRFCPDDVDPLEYIRAQPDP